MDGITTVRGLEHSPLRLWQELRHKRQVIHSWRHRWTRESRQTGTKGTSEEKETHALSSSKTSSLTYVGIGQQQVGRHQFHRCGSVHVLGAAQVELSGWQSLLMFSLRQFALCHQPADLNQLLLTEQPKPGSMSRLFLANIVEEILLWLFAKCSNIFIHKKTQKKCFKCRAKVVERVVDCCRVHWI